MTEKLLKVVFNPNKQQQQYLSYIITYIFSFTAAFQGPSNSASPSSVSSLLNTPVRDPPTQVRSLPNTQTDDKGVMWLSQAGKNESPENVVPLQNDHKVCLLLQLKKEKLLPM